MNRDELFDQADAAWLKVHQAVDLWLNPETRAQYSNEAHGMAVELAKVAIFALPRATENPAPGLDYYECLTCIHWTRRTSESGAGYCVYPSDDMGQEGGFPTTYHAGCELWDGWERTAA